MSRFPGSHRIYLDATNLMFSKPAGDEKLFTEVCRTLRRAGKTVHVSKPIKNPFFRVFFQLFVFPFRVRTGSVVIVFNKIISPLFLFKKAKLVQFVHCLNFIKSPSRLDAVSFFLKFALFGISQLICHSIIVPSGFIKNELRKYFNIRNKVVILPYFFQNSLTIDTVLTEPEEILVFGKIFRNKNIETAVRVFERLKKTHPDLKLTIAGTQSDIDGGYFFELQKFLVQCCSYPECIDLILNVSDEVRTRLFRASDLLLCISSYEGYGFVPLEAFQGNTPAIVSTAVRSVSENSSGYPLIIKMDRIYDPDFISSVIENSIGKKIKCIIGETNFEETLKGIIDEVQML